MMYVVLSMRCNEDASDAEDGGRGPRGPVSWPRGSYSSSSTRHVSLFLDLFCYWASEVGVGKLDIMYRIIITNDLREIIFQF